ncbi:glycosyltransferase [Gloeocapsa sp. PCC 73106]|uniref:glycosyltransferase n=1 Tax=Gloeocapsa sp. PCC 73106 TaxID=102232 RepID=UPI0002AC5E0E|nr:glycosyltransferase [Gloeocapsa sp. PCC 73106]ELR97349.1 glycosyl transferase [Gloeocapsa sp. PCC 73106]
MASKDYFVSVILPVDNHTQSLDVVVFSIITILDENYKFYELIIVNDGFDDKISTQATLLLQTYNGIRLINLSRKFGVEVAISSGLDTAIGDFVVILLPGYDPPELIPELIELCQQGNDILIGIRSNRRDDPLWLRIGANLFYWCCQKLFNIPLTKNATEFRVLSRQVVNAITQVSDNYCYLRLLSVYTGYRNKTFTYSPIRGVKRGNKRNLIELIDLGLKIIFMNSTNPLRLASYLSLIASSFNLFYMLYIVLVYFFKSQVAEGWVTISMQNAVMFFLISVILAILSEYIGLLIVKSRGWANYYVAEEKNSSVVISPKVEKNVVHDSEDMTI